MLERESAPAAIGDLARATGTKVQTIRYYEQIGLLPSPGRTAGGQRRYSRAHERRLAFVRHARELGFPLPAIRELLMLTEEPERPCIAADRIAATHRAEVRRKIARLRSLEEELSQMIEACEGGQARDCRILEVLADHALCAAPSHDGTIGDGPAGM